MKTPTKLLNDLHIIEGHRKDFKLLAPYHYIKQNPGPVRKIYILTEIAEKQHHYPYPIGVVVYVPPFPQLKPRNIATNNTFSNIKNHSDRYNALNKHITYLSRVIIDPRYRKLGLATWLIEETLKLQDYPIIETLTPVDFTNNMFQKLGFKLLYNPAPTWYHLFLNELQSIGISGDLLNHPKIVFKRIEALSKEQKHLPEQFFNRFCKHFQNRRSMIFDLNKVTYALSKVPYPNAYLIKFHNNFTYLSKKA